MIILPSGCINRPFHDIPEVVHCLYIQAELSFFRAYFPFDPIGLGALMLITACLDLHKRLRLIQIRRRPVPLTDGWTCLQCRSCATAVQLC